MSLPKQNRIKKSRVFTRLFTSTRPITSEHFTLRASRDPQGTSYALSVLVSSKIADRATARNALRRKTVAAASRIVHSHAVVSGTRVVISLRTPTLPEPKDLERELLSLMNKSGILNT